MENIKNNILQLKLADLSTFSGESLFHWKSECEQLLSQMKELDIQIINILDRIDFELNKRGQNETNQ